MTPLVMPPFMMRSHSRTGASAWFTVSLAVASVVTMPPQPTRELIAADGPCRRGRPDPAITVRPQGNDSAVPQSGALSQDEDEQESAEHDGLDAVHGDPDERAAVAPRGIRQDQGVEQVHRD